jgi:hypothetical protein
MSKHPNTGTVTSWHITAQIMTHQSLHTSRLCYRGSHPAACEPLAAFQLCPAENTLYVFTITLFMYEFSAQIPLRSCLLSLTFVIKAITTNVQSEISDQRELHFTLGKEICQELT